MNLRSARKIFARSPATFRPMAQWIWNDHVDPDRLAAQLDAMLDAGFGGALIRPGAGLPPGAYLGETWFEAVAAVAKRARKRRASIWIAEDMEAPETQAVVRGILRDAPDHAAQTLMLEDVPPGEIPPAGDTADELVAAFEVMRESARPAHADGTRTPQSLRALTAGSLSEAAPVRRLLFRLRTSTNRLNLFDGDASLHLLDRTHQRYHTQARKYFGNTIGLCLMLGAHPPRIPGAVPWDAEAPALFQETHGYSLIANLPALFFDLPGYETVRFDFWGLLDAMLKEGFTQPFARWAAERGIPHACAFPGVGDSADSPLHLNSAMARFAEDSFAAVMSDGAIPLHEARSIKRQLGKEGVLLIAGDDPAANPARGPMERSVRGVNFMAERTLLASLRGERKRAAHSPIVLQDDNAQLHAQFDAEARFAWMLGQGRASADVLVLHPYTSLRATYSAGTAAESARVHAALTQHFAALTRTIDEAGIDFDCADEAVLARHGRAEHRIMRVGEAEYRVVVLPPLLNIRSSTLGLLHDFAISGGLILAAGSVPELVDGRRSDQVLTFFAEYGERIVQGPDFGRHQAVIDRLKRLKTATPCLDAETERTPECVFTQQRAWDEIDVVSAHNAGDRAVRVRVDCTARVGGRAERWDPLTGAMQPLGTIAVDQAINQTVELTPGDSALVVCVPDEMDPRTLPPPNTEDTRVTPPWTARRMAPNAAALCQCRIVDDGASPEWTGPAELRRLLAERIEQARGPVSLRTQWRFRVAAGAPAITECSAVAELSEGASIRLNSDELVTDDDEWALDPSMRVVPLPPLPAGEHTLEIWRLYAAAGELQAPWLRGPFADATVKDECTRITPARDAIAVGALASQGLGGYAGNVVYTARMDGSPPADGRRVELRLRGLSEPAEIRVDGSRAGFVLPPHTHADLTEFWRAGTRTIEIVLRVPPDNLLAQLRDGRNAVAVHHGLPSPPDVVILVRR